MVSAKSISFPEFNPPESGPKKLDWATLPESMRKRMVETMRVAIEQAMSAHAPGPYVDLDKLRKAVLELREMVYDLLPQAEKKVGGSSIPQSTWDKIGRLMKKNESMILVGETPLADPMGALRFIPHKVKFYVGLAPTKGVIGRALPGHGYIYYVNPELIEMIVENRMSHYGLETWRAFLLQNMAHELTHLVQAKFYPAAFSDYPKSPQGRAYKIHPTECEARWASVDVLLRMHGPTQDFWQTVSDWFGDEKKQSKNRILGLIQKYKDRILTYSSSLMTADAIARQLGITEKAMRAFMEQMEPHEGRLETVEQKVLDAHRRILMLVASVEFNESEYFTPRKVFVENGMVVKVATEGNKAIGSQGTTIETDLDVAQADVCDFDALFVVGGKGMITFSDNKAAQRILRKFVRAGKPVVMICHAPLLAVKAKTVVGRQMTGWPEIRPEMTSAGAEWTGMPVERDGDMFTAMGSEDAESLADILTQRLDETSTITKMTAMLDEEASMRKLARLWKMADAIDKGSMSLEEAERWLKEFERQEFEEEEPAAPIMPVSPTLPVPTPQIKKGPSPKTRGPQEPKEWNIAIELKSPSESGVWPQVPDAPPPGFPFSADALKDGASIRALFRKPETWVALKEMAANPAKRELIQSYLVPKIVLAIGKTWWDINKHRKSLGNAPFGLFAPEEYKAIRTAEVNLDETIGGRGFIAVVNWHVAKVLQAYLATNKPDSNLDAYIYRSLERRMMADAAKRQGFDVDHLPVCAYCRHRRVIETTPPILTETVKHQVKEKGSTRERKIFKCPTCADLIETKEKELRLKEQGASNAKDSLDEIGTRIEKAKAELALDPSNKELQFKVKNLSDMRDTLNPQAATLIKERDELRTEVGNRRRMLDVPYSHLSCINENCSGQQIPLTFVDWESEFWKTPAGIEARRKLTSVYGITENPMEQSVDDTPGSGEISETAGTIPPEWLWDVPFRCPFDGIRFTPREAFGRGKKDPRGKRMGGLFVDPPRTTIWSKPQSLEPVNPEAAHQRIEETRHQTGIDEMTGSNNFLADQNEKLYYGELASSLRQEFYRRKEEHVKRTKGVEGKRTAVLEALLYDAVLEWSYVHPLHLVGYFTKRMPVKRKVIDKETGTVRDHLEIRSLGSGGAEQIVSSLIQTWFAKILRQKNGWEMLRPYLANTGQDGVPPRGYFISVAKQVGGVLEAPCGLRYTKGSPLGEKSSRGTSYGKDIYLAVVEGIWDYGGTPSVMDTMTPISLEKGNILVAGKTSRLDEMDTHDSHRIVFDSASSLTEGSPVLVKALFMPRHTAWIPVKRVMHLRKDLADIDDDMAGIMDVIGRLADENENDVNMIARWRKALRQLGMPGQLKKFDETLRKQLEEKGQ